jgi:hypothetical protein
MTGEGMEPGSATAASAAGGHHSLHGYPAGGTEAVEIDPMGADLVPGGGSDLGRQSADPGELDILDQAAARADQVGVRLRPDAVVAVAAVAELQLQHFADRLQRVQRLIDSRQGGMSDQLGTPDCR